MLLRRLTMKSFPRLLTLTAIAIAFSAKASHANPCSPDIDRAWIEVSAKIQARTSVGRSAPQSSIALLHRQPTQRSIAAAQDTLVDVWEPMESAVAALARAREADRANDTMACEAALEDAHRMIAR